MIELAAIALFVLGGAIVLWLMTRLNALLSSRRGAGVRGAGKTPAWEESLHSEKRLLATEIRRLESAKAGLMDVLSAAEARRHEAGRRLADAERAAIDADRRARMAEKREEEAGWRLQDMEREISRKLAQSAETDRDLAKAKREATEGIAAWTEAQRAKLEHRLNDQYEAEILKMKNEMGQKIHDEVDKIQSYFTDFATSKKTFASQDISSFLTDRLSQMKENL